MAAETPKVARDGTMEATAKEGLAFLEKEKPILAESIKQQMKDCEAQKEENGSGDAPNGENGTAKVPRDNTMVTTAEEGRIFLEKEGGINEEAKTRSQEKELNDSKTEDKEANGENGTAKVPRDRTMAETAEEGENLLENELDEDKEATKRPADEKTEEADEAKKQKVDEEENGSNGEEEKE